MLLIHFTIFFFFAVIRLKIGKTLTIILDFKFKPKLILKNYDFIKMNSTYKHHHKSDFFLPAKPTLNVPMNNAMIMKTVHCLQ